MLKCLFPVLLLSLSCASHAALTVVADLGGESTATLFEAIAPSDDDNASSAQAIPLDSAVFPIVSSHLHPGVVASRHLSLPGMTPLFILGDDPLSLHWLTQQQEKLKSLNATGLVVNVASKERLETLRREAGGLPLLPASGDDLAQRLKLSAYPVLITNSGLSQ
ncbi:integrating conjugative element protein [Salmonella enterica subsp. enterica]|uniref:Integrating conjugative element protein n=1 Tax=Salmonella enterica subsp. enterica serovar Kintambo TaxID=1192730 RepID=A0A5W7RZG3_SALET|nr:integrating conjugative element protein [Salmonella enterica subsp. enterica serovar Kintambo]EBZ5774470.1 integrating conjugative element protein [Salmonella enterica subsp. enterica serovar Redlands]ECE6153292.1 integrating conjugative element protein [Salmonella enterica subsp. enterica]ELX7028052.1 integrating conjugative element protein [Salmonella enterica]MLP08445.1 integrating conjugative element protein [Salmonella enterica subsp. enterica serovar Kedougou]